MSQLSISPLIKMDFVQFQVIFGLTLIICSNGYRSDRESLNLRVAHLTKMSLNSPVIRMNSEMYGSYIRVTPRNFSVVVMFTALSPERECEACRLASNEFEIVAKSFVYSSSQTNSLFFILVDVDDGSDVFRIYKLKSAPVILHIPPNGKVTVRDKFNMERFGFSAEVVARWVEDRTPVRIRIVRPHELDMMFMAAMTLCVLMVVILYAKNPQALYRRSMWATTSIAFSLAMISGHMWNHINGTPFVHFSRNGRIEYIHSSSHGQFVLETYMVAGLYGLAVFGMIMLISAGERKYGGSKLQRMYCLLGFTILVVSFSLLISIFRIKLGAYPYRFLFR